MVCSSGLLFLTGEIDVKNYRPKGKETGRTFVFVRYFIKTDQAGAEKITIQ
ncbi:hypothetical protein HMPREF1570_4262 [Klebsiella oxytoca KA-2]|jgi:hypothetical protein|nr:hypothetical protein HMPREF1570_4262 [Klebsiella oxytoca KA-2]